MDCNYGLFLLLRRLQVGPVGRIRYHRLQMSLRACLLFWGAGSSASPLGFLSQTCGHLLIFF